jgi:hypothetical protein
MSPELSDPGRKRDFGTFLLNSVLGVVFLIALAIAVIYTVPPEHLIIPQHEVAVRVARIEDFTVGSSRMATWGEQAILVVAVRAITRRSRGHHRWRGVFSSGTPSPCA